MLQQILYKRQGGTHSVEDINYIIQGFTNGTIPDYQISAWLMAVYFKGLDIDETAALTNAMIQSGETIDLSKIEGFKVDKHSTGGVGDKTTLVLAPLVAAAGIPVAKMSGRGLGHTGGTLDKLESIPGFNVDLSPEAFINQVQTIGVAICSQNLKLVPADKKLYALRDVTGTVENISLIASSVMSKKLACGADGIVIDLKIGDGAFIKDIPTAHKLANLMIIAAEKLNKKIKIVLTDMNSPLGETIGNSLEVIEAIETLQGNGPKDFQELCVELASIMLVITGKYKDKDEATTTIHTLINNGKALEKFKEMVTAQGGDANCIEKLDLLPKSKLSKRFFAPKTGYIHQIMAHEVGMAAVKLGAGRETKESCIDYGAGIKLLKKIGTFVEQGSPLAEMWANEKALFELAEKFLTKAYIIQDEKPSDTSIIYEVI